ncbi:hypothetical protein DFH07DRAFT_768863 [Mycena maculata]|uniref:Uncharacterized protein n=1 Tax=Mycena maculata TaxID=230809 RepID=A0AAD7JQD2_9AGAR|nr:hypothetical protein DFH07DRAFT_768863 [Mycena maculata]
MAPASLGEFNDRYEDPLWRQPYNGMNVSVSWWIANCLAKVVDLEHLRVINLDSRRMLIQAYQETDKGKGRFFNINEEDSLSGVPSQSEGSFQSAPSIAAQRRDQHRPGLGAAGPSGYQSPHSKLRNFGVFERPPSIASQERDQHIVPGLGAAGPSGQHGRGSARIFEPHDESQDRREHPKVSNFREQWEASQRTRQWAQNSSRNLDQTRDQPQSPGIGQSRLIDPEGLTFFIHQSHGDAQGQPVTPLPGRGPMHNNSNAQPQSIPVFRDDLRGELQDLRRELHQLLQQRGGGGGAASAPPNPPNGFHGSSPFPVLPRKSTGNPKRQPAALLQLSVRYSLKRSG